MAMRRVNKKGRNTGDGQYAALSYDMLTSAAFRSLSGSAVKVYFELRTRFHGPQTNGKMHFGLAEAQRNLKLGRATIVRALDELEDKGFIVCTRRGQWYGRLASEWAITDKGIAGELPTNAWRRWHPGAVQPSTMRPRGRSFRRRKGGPGSSIVGSNTDPSAGVIVPFQNRRPADGSKLEPVEPDSVRVIGSNTDH